MRLLSLRICRRRVAVAARSQCALSRSLPGNRPDVRTSAPKWRGRRALAAVLFGALPFTASAADEADAPQAQANVGPALPERIQDELELDDLRREKERRDLEIALGVEHDLEAMRKLLEFIKTAEEVQEKLRTNPDLADRYDAIVGGTGRARGCACLADAQVLWLGSGAGQADQADIRLGDAVHNVKVGDQVGESRCRLREIALGPVVGAAPASPIGAVLACGGNRRERPLYSAVSGQ